ncbi:hypothetical protein HMI01_24320 [Halolactibacillus miurensis]|uniref:LPXTG-site transpeptidase (Sortase) family protein n=1 Tax=Halolactibacillus miurensis TaxID=306541 RepID=A0A1I6TVK1_9BACI|nr:MULTISPECIES: class F sortase [Halolactibacillus]GEM05444.1 hypothetical protein HMI01_24320 [Halolactibacillus miurensis]SFS93191.1 LPXTG-site transpeptidase (sortase) family protein [Halolactibacillus miurensis]
MRLSDKIIVISLSVITLISFGHIGVNAYQLRTNPLMKVSEAVIDDSFTPYFKSSHLYRSNGFSEPRKITLNPIQSGPIGLTPTQLTIPKINVDASVEFVGETANGQMGVPENVDNVGWYKYGSKPGAQGQAVIAGHVSDRNGPSVFYDLDKLEQGDTVTITDDTGETRQFTVVGKKRYPYDTTALDDVFGPTSKQRLNLITCIGEFDRNVGTHSERLVVFTEQMNETESQK